MNNHPVIEITAESCCITLGKLLADNAEQYKSTSDWPSEIHLSVEREDPDPQEDGTDYAMRCQAAIPFAIVIEPGCHKAYAIYEQAVFECFERLGDLDFGPEITNYYASLEMPLSMQWLYGTAKEAEILEASTKKYKTVVHVEKSV